MTREEFIRQYYPLAVTVSYGTGLFPETIIAAAILESQGLIGSTWQPGASLLASKYNNYFGIKAGYNWPGDTVNLITGEVVNGQQVQQPANFRVYGSAYESFKDYYNFLNSNNRYQQVFKAISPEQQADELQAAGYATNGNYADLLKSIIKNVRDYKPDTTGGGMAALVIIAAIGLFFIFK